MKSEDSSLAPSSIERRDPTWAPVPGVAGLWSIERRDRNGWSLRSAALELRGGGTVVVSPTRFLGDGSHTRLMEMGRPSFALAPNHFHWLGLDEFCTRYPEAHCVASDRAARRLAKKARRAFSSLDALRERLPEGVRVLEPPGLANGEVWLSVPGESGRAWVASDAFFHVPVSPAGLMGWVLRRTQTVPGLRVGKTFKWLAVSDATAYVDWIDATLNAERPTTLVPGHGDVLTAPDLATRLRDAVREQLRR